MLLNRGFVWLGRWVFCPMKHLEKKIGIWTLWKIRFIIAIDPARASGLSNISKIIINFSALFFRPFGTCSTVMIRSQSQKNTDLISDDGFDQIYRIWRTEQRHCSPTFWMKQQLIVKPIKIQRQVVKPIKIQTPRDYQVSAEPKSDSTLCSMELR